MSSAIAGLLLFGTLAALSLYNAVRCGKSVREFRKRGRIQKAEIISFQKRKEKTSASGRYTTVTWYDITVKIELSPERAVTRTIRTTSPRARKYRGKSHADIAFPTTGGKPIQIEALADLKLKEDLKSSPEIVLSLVLFIIFSVIFIMNIVGSFA